MDVQTIFYTLGSIFLFLGLVVLVAMLFVIWKAYEAVKKTTQDIQNLKDEVSARVSDITSSGTTKIASSVGMGIATFVIAKMRKAFK